MICFENFSKISANVVISDLLLKSVRFSTVLKILCSTMLFILSFPTCGALSLRALRIIANFLSRLRVCHSIPFIEKNH